MPDYEVSAHGRTFTISSPQALTPDDLRGRISAVETQLNAAPTALSPGADVTQAPPMAAPRPARKAVRPRPSKFGDPLGDGADDPNAPPPPPKVLPVPVKPLPGDPGGVTAHQVSGMLKDAMAQTGTTVALKNLPFDLANYYAVVNAGGKGKITWNEPSELAGHRTITVSTKKAAGIVARALGIPQSKVPELLNPKSMAFSLVKDYVRQGHGAGKQASAYGSALQGGAGAMASAIVATDPSIATATTGGLIGRAFAAASSPSKTLRILAADKRAPEEVSALESAGETLVDIMAFGGAGGLGAAASEGVAGALARKGLQSVTAKTLARFAADKTATTFAGKAAQRATSFAIENAALQAVPIIGHASDLTEENGRPFLHNLKDAAGESAQGFVHVMSPAIFSDANASPQDKAIAAVMQGAMLLGAGFKGYDYVHGRAKALGIDPIIVERLIQEGKHEVQRGHGIEKPSARIPLAGEPDVAPTPSVPMATGAPSPELAAPSRRPGPAPYLNDPNARTSGKAPVLVGEQPAREPVLMPSGEQLIRHPEDRARLDAMKEEFGNEAGLAAFVKDRTESAPAKATPSIITGDEISRAEYEALQRKVAKMKTDRQALDDAPSVPKNVREGLVRSVDADGDRLDPFSDLYDDDLAATLHTALFGEHPSRDAHGDVSSNALARVRDQVRSEQQGAYGRESKADAVTGADDLDHVQDLALKTGVKRDPETTKDYIADNDPRDVPNGPEDVITAKRANNRRGWKIDHKKTAWVGLEGMHQGTARALVEYALSRESDHSYLRRSEVAKWKQKGLRPKFLKLSEMIQKEVGSDWQRSDFEDWQRIAIPKPIVAEYVRNRMAEVDTAREVLKSVAPTLSEAEIRDVIEHAARGGEFPAADSRAGHDRAAHDGGTDAVDGRDASGDLGARRPQSPRQPARERLDREIAAAEARLARARVDDGPGPRLSRPGEIESGPAPELVDAKGNPVGKRTPKPIPVRAKAEPKADAPKLEAVNSAPRTKRERVEQRRAAREETANPKPEPKAEEKAPVQTSAVEKTEPKGPGHHETRNADTEAERAQAGTAPVERQEYTTKSKADEAGRKAVEDGADHIKLAEEVASRPRPIDATENGILKEGRKRLFEESKKAIAKRNAAEKAGDVAAAAKYHAEYLLARDRVDRNTEALVKGGREISAALGARRGEEPVDLADGEAVVQEARWAKGDGDKPGTLKPHAEDTLRNLADQLKAAEEAARSSDVGRKAAEAELARLKKEGYAIRKSERGDRKAELKSEMETLSSQLSRSLQGTANMGVPLGPEQVKLLAKMARNAVHQGAVTLEEMIDFVRTHLPENVRHDIDDETIRDAFSGHGVVSEPAAKSDVQARVDELRRVAKVTADIEDATAGTRQPSRTRGAVSDEVAKLRKVRDALRKEKGLNPQTKRTLQSVEDAVAALEKRQAELQAMTARGETPPKRAKVAEDAAVAEARQKVRTALSANKMAETIRDLETQLSTGTFTEPKPRTVRDPSLDADAKRIELLRARIRNEIRNQRPVTPGDTLGRIQHFNIFSGPGIFAKLAGATAAHVPLEALTDALAAPVRRLSAGAGKNLGDVAASQVLSTKAEAMGVAKMLSKATLGDAWQKLRHGVNSLDAAAENRGQVPAKGHHGLWDLFGNLHGAVKTPLQRFAYAKGLEQRSLQAARAGLDVRDLGVQAEIVAGAYNDSLEAILRNDNRVAKTIGKVFDAMGPNAGKVAGTFVPVTRVGANYVSKGIQYTGFGLVEGLATHLKALRSEGKLTPQQADAVIKAYKRGGAGVGIAALVLGTDLVKGPGYYAPGVHKKDKDHYGDLDIGGLHVPHALAHNPAFEAMQFWLTVKNAMRHAKGDGLGKAGSVAFPAAYGLLSQTPGLDAIVDTGNDIGRGEASTGKAIGNHVRSILVPQLAQLAARKMDADKKGNPKRRRVRGFRDSMKEAIPGLRSTLKRKQS